jgi:amino acid adenylation domain-containing protein
MLGLERVGVDDSFFTHNYLIDWRALAAVPRMATRVYEGVQTAMTIANLFEQPLDASRSEGLRIERPPIAPADRRGPLPSSLAQQGLWFLDQWEPGNPAYNIPIAIRIAGPLDVATLQRSLDAIVQRHEALRTTFASADGQPIQVIAGQGAIAVPTVDLSDQPAGEREAAAFQIAREEARHRFDLEHGPLIRAALLRLDVEDHLLVVVVHHIISDDRSMGVLFRELGALYAGFRAGLSAPLPALPIQYADFALWQRQWLKDESDHGASSLERQLAYWRQQLAGAPAALELPPARPRPPARSFNGATHTFVLPAVLVEALAALGREEGATLLMALLATFQTLLYRYTAQEDIVVGMPIAGRTRAELEPLIGCFVNALVLRSNLSGDSTFRELLRRVRQTCLEAYAHQDLPFERLVEAMQPARDPSRTPLFQVMLVLQDAPTRPFRLGELTLAPTAIDSGTSKFDLTLYLEEVDRGLRGTIEYSTDLFDAATIARLAGHFQMLLEGAVADPGQSIVRLPLLREAERQQLLVEWNATTLPYPVDTCIHQLVEAQAARTPDAIALVAGPTQLSYAQLQRRANQLARYLQACGVGPDTPVALCLPRSADLLIALLGVLKAGGLYVPLDPTYPPERIRYMLADSQAAVLLIQESISDLHRVPLGETKIVNLDVGWQIIDQQPAENLEHSATPQHLAYVIYTSGSTGAPKGVAISHQNAVAFLTWATSVFSPQQLGGVLAATSVCFDLSVFELFAPLCCGGTVILAENVLQLPDLSGAAEVTLVNSVPSAVAALLQLGPLPPAVSTVNLAGEALPASLVQQLYQQPQVTQVTNLYGPSETTTYSTWARLPRDATTPPIGRPIANTQVYLLDAQMQQVPVEVPGELYIGGVGLARGYLGRPDLTAEKFVPNPFADYRLDDGTIRNGERLYRTGDLARYRLDGQIEFLGRLDHQVKVRGYRIELGEVEATLLLHAMVYEAVVVARRDTAGEPWLVAYIVPTADHRPPTTAEPEAADHSSIVGHPEGTRSSVVGELRAFVKERLPDYMVPSVFVTLNALPRTPNGKIDRRALPDPGSASDALGHAYVAPRTPVEAVLAGMWSDALQLAQVSIHANFFDLGGHSLNATRIVSRIRQAFQIDLAVRHLFAAPTIASLADHMIATETQPGRTDKIAGALQRLKRMSTADRQKILQQKKASEGI